jgi:hypothetical protein
MPSIALPAPGGLRQGKNAHKSISKNRAAIQPFLIAPFFTGFLRIGVCLLKITPS